MEINELIHNYINDDSLLLSPSLLLKIFEKYGNIEEYPFTIEKEKIEKILYVLSNELYFPHKFEFNNQIITYSDVITSIEQIFSM